MMGLLDGSLYPVSLSQGGGRIVAMQRSGGGYGETSVSGQVNDAAGLADAPNNTLRFRTKRSVGGAAAPPGPSGQPPPKRRSFNGSITTASSTEDGQCSN